ncbi:hypothetical protein lbkm_0689 [Lachnospiraceae bacterium KM106-2]|nr:hypothetical protein lbkm_0689 [Lachnospiraceae bacterium KM106-2]
MRKIVTRLTLQLKTGMDYFMSVPVFELREIVEEVVEIGK